MCRKYLRNSNPVFHKIYAHKWLCTAVCGHNIFLVTFTWRRHPDLNRGSGCCRPTPYHLAIAPYFRFCEYATFVHKNENLVCPHYCKGWYSLFGSILKYSEYSEKLNCWSGLRGSNSLPPPWQGGALPDELNPHLYKPHKRYFLYQLFSF